MALTIPKSFAGTPASIKSQAEALLARATTLAEVNSIVALARSSNVNVDSALLSKTKTAIADTAKKAPAPAPVAPKAVAAPVVPTVDPVAAAAARVGLSVADYTAAVNNLIATNAAYKNKTVATISSQVGAKIGDPTALIKTAAKNVADQAIADKAAQAQGFASAQAKKEAQNAANNAALQKQQITAGLNQQVQTASDIDTLVNVIQQAKNQGISLDSALLEKAGAAQASKIKSLDDINAFNVKAQAAGITVPKEIVNALATSAASNIKSFDDLQKLQKQVQGLGGTIEQSAVDKSIDAISRSSGAVTRESLATLQQQAQAAGFQASSSYIDQQTAAIVKAESDAAAERAAVEKAAADKQAKIATFQANLQQPGTQDFNEAAQFGQTYQVPGSDVSLMARIQNKITGEPAGWYQSTDNGKTYRPSGAGQDTPGMTKAQLTKAYFTDSAANTLIGQGYQPEQAQKMLSDYSANYDDLIGASGPGTSSKWLQGLTALTTNPQQYANFQQSTVPSAKADATKAINDKLNAGGFYNQVFTRDQLDSIVQQAREQGLPINQNYVSRVESGIANREKTLATELPVIPTNDLKDIGGTGSTTQRISVDGREYFAVPADPVTGKPAGYYTYFNDQTGQEHFASVDDYKSFLKTGVVPSTVLDQSQFQNLFDTTNANVRQTETANEMTDWYKTVADPEIAKSLSENASAFRTLSAPDGSTWALKPGDSRAGTESQWYVMEPGTGSFKSAELTAEGSNVTSDTAVPYNEFQNQYLTQARSNDVYAMEKYRAERALKGAPESDDDFFGDLLKLVAVAAIAWIAAPYVTSWLASVGAEGAALLSEGSSAAAGLAEAGMGVSEIAATLEMSGIPTAAADAMAQQAIGIASGAVDVSAVASASGITAETLAMANATLDPIAALNAAQGWTAVDMAYLATIGVPVAVMATAEATNVALGLPASQVGTTAAAEVAGTVPAGTTAEVVASQPVVPTGAETATATAPVAPPGAETVVTAPTTPAVPGIDTSQMIPTVDAAGNSGFFDPATGQVYNGAGEIVASTPPTAGPGTQVAGPAQIGSASGTAGTTSSGIPGDTMFSGKSFNPITNAITNAGVTNPIVSGALSGAATTGAINLLTGKPITAKDLVTGAIGGGVAGGIGGAMGAPTTVLDAALKGAATNVGAGIVVNAITGQPINANTLAMSAVIGGTIGAGAQMYGSSDGNITYRYDDGSTLTVNSSGTPVSVTDFNGANVPIARVQVPVEDRTPTPVSPAPAVIDTPIDTPSVPVPGDLDSGPYIPDVPVTPVTLEPAPVAPAPSVPVVEQPYDPYKDEGPSTANPNAPTGPVSTLPDQGEITVVAPRPPPVPGDFDSGPYIPTEPVTPVVTPPPEPVPAEQPPTPEPAPVEPAPPTAPPIYVPPYVPPEPFAYGPITPLDWGQGVPIGVSGLNPGYITNVPAQYQTQNMQQSKFYYGPKPYQSGGTTGQVFDPNLYRSAPAAPISPFGLQQMYNPQTQTIENLLAGVRQASAVAPYNVPMAPRV